MAASLYENWPLTTQKHIRLLSVPSQPDGHQPTRFIVSSFNLDEAPPYIALSYTWGSPDDKQYIHLQPGNVSLPVTKNCHSALSRLIQCYLKPEKSAIYFWIDAICIDQSNIPERNSQVSLMADIYQTATLVVIDVGEMEDSEDTNLALSAIIKLDGLSKTDRWLPRMGFDDGCRVRDSVQSFYLRPWFHRIWVLQEAFMATKAEVMCGTRVEQWAEFRVKFFLLDTHSAFGTELVMLPPVTPRHPAPFVLIQGAREARSFLAERDLLTLLCHSRTCEAGDPRDKVFALYSFLSDAAAQGLRADYSDTKSSVYTAISEWILKQSGPSVLSCVWGDLEKRDSTLPSWVPDWADSSVRPDSYFGIPIPEWLRVDAEAYFWPIEAAGDTKAFLKFQDSASSSRRLVIRGLVVDRIEQIGSIMEKPDRGISELAAKNRKATGLDDTYSRLRPSRGRGPAWLVEYGIPALFNNPSSEDDNIGMYYNTVIGRDIAATESGYFGIVPECARTGDHVCIFLGAGTPFILRPVNDAWRLVGESYFYGLMSGEAVRGLDISATENAVPQDPLRDFVIE
ncbi:HET-domain-containing protein [Cadophora sp. DSE1049]|nr:HET-domain-containing protein [Cadophora sp. DSE1049]